MSLPGERKSRSGSAFALSLTSGVIILLSGIGMGLFFIFPVALLLPFPALGLLIIVCSLASRANPNRHALWGAIIVASSAVSSWQSVLWLYYVPPWGAILIGGVVLGLIGGVGWIRYRPSPAASDQASS